MSLTLHKYITCPSFRSCSLHTVKLTIENIIFFEGLVCLNFNYQLSSSISLSTLSLSLTLKERERADTLINLPHHHKLFKHLEVTYSQVWYIIGIVSSSPTYFHSEKIGLIRVNYDTPVSIRVNKHFMWLILKCYMSLESSAQALLISTQIK